MWAKVSNSHSSSSSRPSTGGKDILSIGIDSGYFRFCQNNSRLPCVNSLDQEQAERSGLARPSARQRSECKRISFRRRWVSRTCTAFQSKNSGVSSSAGQGLWEFSIWTFRLHAVLFGGLKNAIRIAGLEPKRTSSAFHLGSAMLKGFGRRPLARRLGEPPGAGVRKPRKEETAGRKGAVWWGAAYGDF